MAAQRSVMPQAARQPQRRQARRPRVAAVASTALSGASSGEWERWLAQFRPEAQALMNLMVDINCRLAREAYTRQTAQQA